MLAGDLKSRLLLTSQCSHKTLPRFHTRATKGALVAVSNEPAVRLFVNGNTEGCFVNIRFRIVHKDLKFDANLKTLGENDTVSLGGGGTACNSDVRAAERVALLTLLFMYPRNKETSHVLI